MSKAKIWNHGGWGTSQRETPMNAVTNFKSVMSFIAKMIRNLSGLPEVVSMEYAGRLLPPRT